MPHPHKREKIASLLCAARQTVQSPQDGGDRGDETGLPAVFPGHAASLERKSGFCVYFPLEIPIIALISDMAVTISLH